MSTTIPPTAAPAAPPAGEHLVGDELTYGDFGRQLFRLVLTEERIEQSMATVLGDTIDVGPFGAGPGRVLAKIKAAGTIGSPSAARIPDEAHGLVAFRVMLPIRVDFDLDLSVDRHRFQADVLLPLRLTARAGAPLTIVWDIRPPEPHELEITVSVDKRRTEFIRRVAGIDDELRRFMVTYVTRELQKEYVIRATHIHLGEVIDAAWPMISAQFLEPASRH